MLPGDRAPPIAGATRSGTFYSLDAQAGRPALLATLGSGDADAAQALVARLLALDLDGADVVPLAPFDAALAARLDAEPQARERVVYLGDSAALDILQPDGAPAAALIDRSGRIVALTTVDNETDLNAFYRQAAPRLASEPSSGRISSAPILVVPNIITPQDCAALIAWFEASDHAPGVMASVKDGVAVAKLDETKKRRRDVELTADSPLHAKVVAVMAQRCAPELKRAFQADITFADRILIARYDDDGGYFTRHRDNVAAHTAFREFALSINLNTGDYEGGALRFPEYDDHSYSPPAGGAIMFSASLLHEVTPIIRGSRYVLLSFLCTAAGQARYLSDG